MDRPKRQRNTPNQKPVEVPHTNQKKKAASSEWYEVKSIADFKLKTTDQKESLDLVVYWKGYEEPSIESFCSFSKDSAAKVERFMLRSQVHPYFKLKQKFRLLQNYHRKKTGLLEKLKSGASKELILSRLNSGSLEANDATWELSLSQQLSLAKFYCERESEKLVWSKIIVFVEKINKIDSEPHYQTKVINAVTQETKQIAFPVDLIDNNNVPEMHKHLERQGLRISATDVRFYVARHQFN